MAERVRAHIPEPTVLRLSIYQRILHGAASRGERTISSAQLAEAGSLNAAKVRRDLSHLGTFGMPGTGYDVAFLLERVDRALGLDRVWPVVIVGVGHLGRALARSPGFTTGGFRVVGLLDTDPAILGATIEGVAIRHLSELRDVAREHSPSIGVVTTPAGAAQHVAESLVEVGVCSILNFAPAVLNLPDRVLVRTVDLSVELQVLTFYQARLAGGAGLDNAL